MKSFEKEVLEKLKEIPRGRISTYKILAEAVGKKKMSRQVGQILKNNPDIPKTPCHRIVKSDGQVGGYALGSSKKKRILKEEGLRFAGDKIIDFDKILYYFD